jgi:pimeloyl-ACP methyl ester carboxylesterase
MAQPQPPAGNVAGVSPAASIRRGYADTSRGQVHYAEVIPEAPASPAPVLLLHQTPRSWDEYREVLPLLGRRHRAIAMDTIGFGASAPISDHGIETYASVVVEFIQALRLPRVALVGHHTGGLIAIETAARAPGLIGALVLSSTPHYDAGGRAKAAARPPIDQVAEQADGTHLAELWRKRQPYYPPDRPDLLTRLVRDALVLGPEAEAGHEACKRYRLEDRAGGVQCPVLCIGASADPFAFPDLEPLAARFPQARVAVIEGGMVPLMEQRPAEVAEVISEFLS